MSRLAKRANASSSGPNSVFPVEAVTRKLFRVPRCPIAPIQLRWHTQLPQFKTMKREYHRWYSSRLGFELGVVAYGHYGSPIIGFPTSAGDEFELEGQGMVGALAEFIDKIVAMIAPGSSRRPRCVIWVFNSPGGQKKAAGCQNVGAPCCFVTG